MELRQKSRNGLFSSLNGINGVFERLPRKAGILIYKDAGQTLFDSQGLFAFSRESESLVPRNWLERSEPWIIGDAIEDDVGLQAFVALGAHLPPHLSIVRSRSSSSTFCT
jgi:hypothetical protein